MQSSTASSAARLACTVAVWRSPYALSEAEADVLVHAARGDRRGAIARARGTTEATVKTQIQKLLEQTGDDHLHGAVERILREVAR